MPWGDPSAVIPTWCAGCGKFGAEYRERALLTPTFRARICPPCGEAGWHLTTKQAEPGRFWAPKPVRGAA